MRVLFTSTRGTGHLQPLVPYARALLARGHEVLVTGPAELSKPLSEAGLAHTPFDHPGDEALLPIWKRLHQATQSDSLLIALREIFAGVNAKVALPKLQDTIRTWKPDLVLRDSVEFAAVIAAERAPVPHARVAVHLVSFEEDIPNLVADQIDSLRQQVGLPPNDGASLRSEPVFTCFPASMDGPETTQSPFRSRQLDEQPSPEPPPWLSPADPRPLIYITFGTIAGTSPHFPALYRTTLDAVANLPLRALLTIGRAASAEALAPIPPNVHVESWVPQRDVLPHVRALVCHGGSGTVLGALAAGLPMVVVPLFADQPHNASRIQAVGAGLSLPNATTDTLRAAIQRVLSEPEFRTKARRIADEIAALPPIDNAVDVMARIAAGASSQT